MPPAPLLWVMFEGTAELQFFQLAVVQAAREPEAAEVVRAFLKKRGARLVELDSGETRAVAAEDIPPAWRKDAVAGEGVLGLSPRIWVKPEDS